MRIAYKYFSFSWHLHCTFLDNALATIGL